MTCVLWHKFGIAFSNAKVAKMKKEYLPLFLGLALLGSCKKDLVSKYKETSVTTDGSSVNVSSMQELEVPADFKWETTKTYSITIKLKDNHDLAVPSKMVRLMNDGLVNQGVNLVQGATNAQGEFTTSLTLPSGMKELVFNTSFIGIAEDIIIPLTSSNINITFGGSNPAKFNTVTPKEIASTSLGKAAVNKFNVVPSTRTWSMTSDGGVPNYLETDDVVNQGLLNSIATALPSSVRLNANSPMLAENAVRTIRVNELAEVFVTFVSEGASYKNVLFYYAYNENNPPASVNDISNYTVVFPNTSWTNSGGGLTTGNKVKLGIFPAGTIIGYGIAANGWRGGSDGWNGVTPGLWTVFGEKSFNPEADNSLKQHMVLLSDLANHRIVMGFEDIRRDMNTCDHDFNDVLFYTTSNPIDACDDEDIPPLPPVEDEDGDGIDDEDDDYPTDPNKAFNNPTGTGSIAFEDQWPSTGDYDLNDVVVNYNYNVVTNATNKVVRVEGSLTLRATGGSFQNGFGVQFPVERSKVSGVTGATLEAGQTNTVLVLFQNMRNQMTNWNTLRPGGTSPAVTYNIAFNVSNGPSLSTFGLSCYNPFIWNGSMGRGYEIHLAGKTPTDLANGSVFGTNRDASNIATGDTYVSKNGRLPWAIQTPANFSYPKEKADINTAYLKFASWVISGGTLFTDWYSNTSGYRNAENIY